MTTRDGDLIFAATILLREEQASAGTVRRIMQRIAALNLSPVWFNLYPLTEDEIEKIARMAADFAGGNWSANP